MANYVILLILLENYLTSLLKDQPNLLCGVKGQVSSLQNDLKIIIDIFKNNNVARHYGDDVKKVVDQVKDVCIEVEDVIDKYLAKVLIQRRQLMGNPLGRLSHLISHVKVFCDAVNKTRGIAKDIRKHISDNDVEEAANGTGVAESGAAAAQVHQSPQRRDFVEEDSVVGFDDYTTSLVNQLTDLGNSHRNVISIIGFGGLGKTTLARKIYKDPRIKVHFGCVAWVYVSQDYNRKRFFLDLLEYLQLNYHNLSDEDLAPTVSDHLRGKRYFVVMDEVWQTQVWQEVGEAFPDDSNGSRILITSRHKEIASHASPDPPYLLPLLDNKASWELFCTNKKLMFLGEENCSPKLKNLGKKFVEGCKGLPLSIIELQEILANEGKSYQTWSNYFFDDINGYSKRTSKWGLEFVALSYNHLPHHLKPCFLYVGVFPKDSEIQTRVLTQLWIAEGFVQQTENKTADSVAEDYLEELINRSLIQVTSRRSDESAKTCRVHSLIRDFCTTESLQEKFLEVQLEDDLALYGKGLEVQPEDDHLASRRRGPRRHTEGNLGVIGSEVHGDPTSSSVNPRRFSVHCKSLSYYVAWNTSDTSSARSLLYFCGQNQIDFDKKKWVRLHQGLKFVRVLSFFNINIKGRLELSGIENLIFLRCFKISGTSIIEKLPDSMCNLRFLETVDLGVQVPDRLWPKNLWRMKQLRRLYSLPMMFPPDDHKEMGTEYSCNLQVLSGLYVDKKTTDFLVNSNFPNLLDLGLFYKWSECLNQSEITKVLKSLENLQHLQRLSISGFTKCDNYSYILATTLTKVRLTNSYVDSNLFSIFGNLPNLRALTIKLMEMDCEADLIKMEAGMFPQLQVFKMIGYDIQMWELERGAMPKLLHLVILGNQRMEDLPNELWNREALKLVQMSAISESLRNWLLKSEYLMEERHLELPPPAGNPRYLQGRVLELKMNNGCMVLIGGEYFS